MDLARLFEETDVDGSGYLTRQEFSISLRDPRAVAYLKVLGIETDNLSGLFELVDMDDNGQVEMGEFLKAFPRLMGPAASVDIAHLHADMAKLSRRVFRFQEYVADQLDGVEKLVRLRVAGVWQPEEPAVHPRTKSAPAI